MKLTFTQKLLRPLINYLVERWFPDSAFWGDDYLTVFRSDDITQKWGSATAFAAMFITANLRETNAKKASFEFSEMTSHGVPVGSWKLTLECVDDAGEAG